MGSGLINFDAANGSTVCHEVTQCQEFAQVMMLGGFWKLQCLEEVFVMELARPMRRWNGTFMIIKLYSYDVM